MSGRNRRPRALALGALLTGVAVILAAFALGGGDEPQTASERPKRAAAKTDKNTGDGAQGAAAQPAGDAGAGEPAPAEADGADGAALNEQGFALINEGRPEDAVPVLERAVAALEGSGDELTYNYALFNLAHALRLSGRPQEAIPLLEQRLEYPNQQDVVAAELEAAREDAGLTSADETADDAKPEKEPKPGKGPKKSVPPPFEDDD